MSKVPPLSHETLDALCGCLCEWNSGSEIADMLKRCGIREREGSSKHRRLFAAFDEDQKHHGCANTVLQYVQRRMTPVSNQSDPALYNDRLATLNRILIHAGLAIGRDGNVSATARATTLDESRARLNQLRQRLTELGAHREVIRYCRAEIHDENYFHAVFEAAKSLPDRVRTVTGLSVDGHELYGLAFAEASPLIALNTLSTKHERAHQRAVGDMLRSLYTLYRNPLAHESKINRPMGAAEAIEVLMVISLAHRLLEPAVRRPS